MRPALLVPLLLVPLLSSASAQDVTVSVHLDPLKDPITPLGAVASVPMTVQASCPASAAAPPGLTVTYAVKRAPAWATVVISPTNDHMDFQQCAGGQAVFHAVLTVAASDAAPAFQVEPLEVTVHVSTPTSSTATADAGIPITAGYYSRLDVQAPVTQRSAAPREIVTFPIQVANYGNGNTRVAFEKLSADDGVVPAPPPPLLLGAHKAGSGQEEATLVKVQAYRTSAGMGVQSFTLRYQATYFLDSKLEGVNGTLTFRLVPGAANATDASEAQSVRDKLSPGPSLPLALVPLAVAALLVRRR